MAKILIVEDDAALGFMLESLLIGERHTVDIANTGNQGLEQIAYCQYDLIILDVDLPDLSGIDICHTFRLRGGTTPILFLTGKGRVSDKVAGLEAGGDDYLSKPFHRAELFARIKALLRRPANLPASTLVFGDLVLDSASGSVTKEGMEIHLLPREFALLEFLLRHPDRTFTAETIVARVWPTEAETSPESIRPYINRLRQKIDTPGKPSIIQTSRGRGYMVVSSKHQQKHGNTTAD